MKKLLSLTLVALMLLTSLVSCDMETAKGYLINFLEQFTTTPETPKEIRTTITEEEYLNAFKADNYTIREMIGEESSICYVIDGNKIGYQIDYGEISMTVACDLEKHVVVSNTSVGNLAYFDESIVFEGDTTLQSMGLLDMCAYETLVYNAETKSYTYTDERETIELFFEDGALSKIVMMYDGNFEGEIYDIGTSVVEIPEYIIVNDGKIDPSNAPADVRTTVTDKELASHLDLRNFSINAVTLQYGVYAVEASLKVADTALELTIDMMDAKEVQYITLVDGKFLSIERLGNVYRATSIGATMEDLENAIETAREYMSTEYLTYNEEGRYYTLEVDGETFHLFFENGQIVKAVYIMEDGGTKNEVIIVVSNVGTTEVVLPEYTVDDEEEYEGTVTPPTYEGVVTEEQWNEQTNATNYTVESVTKSTRLSTGESLGGYSTHFKSAENGSEEPGHNYPYRAYLEDGVYNITYNEETARYEARKTNYTVEDFSISSQTVETKLNYSDFTYNEYQGRYEGTVTVGDLEYQMYLYFNNGELVKIGMLLCVYEQDLQLEAEALISNVGTTVVELPEYVIVE